jgi:hypothetical protein
MPPRLELAGRRWSIDRALSKDARSDVLLALANEETADA